MPLLPSEPDDDPGAPKPANVGEMFVYLSEQMAAIGVDVRAGRAENAALRAEVMPHIVRLNRRVFGSIVPPDAPPPAPGVMLVPAPPLSKAVATHHDSIEMLSQEVSNLRGEVVSVRTLTAQQSKTMGLAPPAATLGIRARAYVLSRAGMKDALALVTAIGVVLTLWRAVTAPVAASPPPLPVISGTR